MKFLTHRKKRIYLDYAAATPVGLSVLEAMKPYWRDMFANAGGIHKEGVLVRAAIENARLRLARVLKVRPEGVVFTGSGTESNNLAILGVVETKRAQGVAYTDMEVVSTPIEHPSILQTLEYLKKLGVTIKYVSVDTEGLIVIQSLQDALTSKTVLVTFAYANSEIGTVQEVGKITRMVRTYEKEYDTRIVVHIDAAQAPLWLPCQLEPLQVDILTLDAGKCYGPKGVGVLTKRNGVEIASIMHGGGQEGGLRPATENTAGIVGAVESIVIAQEQREKRVAKVQKHRDRMIKKLLEIDGVVLNGSAKHRIANNVNIAVPGIDSEFAVISLDEAGIACSTKSACGATNGQGSTVVRIISDDEARAISTIRFSLGEETTARDIHYTVTTLQKHITKTRLTMQKLTIA